MPEILDAVIKKHREAQGVPPMETAPEKVDTLQEILANDEQSELFGIYLQQLPEGRRLGAELRRHKDERPRLDRDDYALITEKRQEFLELMAKSKEIIKFLDEPVFPKVVEATPELQTIANTHGMNGIKDALKDQLPRVAITDPRRFEQISQAVRERPQLDKKMEEWEKDIEAAFSSYGVAISKQEIIDLLHGGDPSSIARDIEKLNTGVTRSFTRSGWFGLKKYPQINTDAATAEQWVRNLSQGGSQAFKNGIADLDNNLRNIGLALETSLVDNPGVHQALMSHLQTGAVEKKRGMSYRESLGIMTESMPSKKDPAWKDRVKDFNADKKKEALQRALEDDLARKRADALSEALKADLKKAREEAFEEATKKEVWDQYIKEYLAEPANISAGVTEEKNIPPDELDNLKKEFPDYYKLTEKDRVAERDKKLEEFSKTYTIDPARERAVRDEFARTYKDTPQNDAEKHDIEEKMKWEDITQENLDPRDADYLVQDFSTASTRDYMKTQKKGFWSAIGAEFRQEKIFNDLYASLF